MPGEPRPVQPRVIVLSPSDNVGVVTADVVPGLALDAAGASLTALEAVPLGHKVALGPIAHGAKVIKYGAVIGSATADIDAGRHVHTHNLKSNYLPTYTLQGDSRFIRDEQATK